jgi:hydrogenase nickel insertion protein HypA
MHEISLVQGLLQQLHAIAKEHNVSRVVKVTMAVGPLSGVVVDSLTFGFDILTKEDELVRDAELEIVIPKVTYRCSSCDARMQSSGERPKHCSKCSEAFLIPEGGDDLILQRVEME